MEGVTSHGRVGDGNNMLQGNLVAIYNFLKRGNAEGGADLFSLVTNDRI